MTANTEPQRPGFSDIQAASERIRGRIDHTPVVHDPQLDEALGCAVFLKCENHQTTGAFKLRGASNAVARLRASGDARDVATHSSGNHGAALALAARRDGRGAHVVMPRDSVPAKIEAVRSHAAAVILCEPGQAPREAGLRELVAQGMVAVPPYDDPDIIAGQGTAALELIDFMNEIDILLTPLGGGGLLAGSAIAARGMRPGITLFGAEPAGAADAWESFHSGRRVTEWTPDTIADGLRAVIGVMNFAIIHDLVDDILLTSEQAIVDAMKLIWARLGMAIEPSSAVAIAAMREHPERFEGRRTGVIITGGNVDLEFFPWLREQAD